MPRIKDMTGLARCFTNRDINLDAAHLKTRLSLSTQSKAAPYTFMAVDEKAVGFFSKLIHC